MPSASQIDLSDIRILCVDDDPVMRAIVREALHRRGCRAIEQAGSGEEALALCAHKSFDLLICDFQMAPMNGLAFLRALGAAGYGAGMPVIMLSAEADPSAIAAAQDLGISAWVPKPVSVVRMLERIAAVLGHAVASEDRSAGGNAEADERHHTRLMAMIEAAEKLLVALPYRQNGTFGSVHPVLQPLEQVAELADMLGYGLVRHLANRGMALLRNMPVGSDGVRGRHPEVDAALGSILTAIKRVARKRIAGDGGVSGLRLLNAIDDTLTAVGAAQAPASTRRRVALAR